MARSIRCTPHFLPFEENLARQRACGPIRAVQASNLITSAAHNLSLDELAIRLRGVGPPRTRRATATSSGQCGLLMVF
jgi:hypothetical protein